MSYYEFLATINGVYGEMLIKCSYAIISRKRQIDAETVHPQPTPGPQNEMTNSEPTYRRGTMQRETGRSKVGGQKCLEDNNRCYYYSFPSLPSRERKWRRTFRAIFSSPSLIPAYVVGNSRRSTPSTTHTLYRALEADAATGAVAVATPGSEVASLESPGALKNRGRGYPCTLQYSITPTREKNNLSG